MKTLKSYITEKLLLGGKNHNRATGDIVSLIDNFKAGCSIYFAISGRTAAVNHKVKITGIKDKGEVFKLTIDDKESCFDSLPIGTLMYSGNWEIVEGSWGGPYVVVEAKHWRDTYYVLALDGTDFSRLCNKYHITSYRI